MTDDDKEKLRELYKWLVMKRDNGDEPAQLSDVRHAVLSLLEVLTGDIK